MVEQYLKAGCSLLAAFIANTDRLQWFLLKSSIVIKKQYEVSGVKMELSRINLIELRLFCGVDQYPGCTGVRLLKHNISRLFNRNKLLHHITLNAVRKSKLNNIILNE